MWEILIPGLLVIAVIAVIVWWFDLDVDLSKDV